MKASDFIYDDSISFTISDVEHLDYRPEGCRNVNLKLQVKSFVSEDMILQLLRTILKEDQ